jgi:hypothetical protein
VTDVCFYVAIGGHRTIPDALGTKPANKSGFDN